MNAVLELRGAGLQREGNWLVRDIDLALGPAERLVILGPSGSGKTMLLRLILGLETPTTGEIRLNGEIASRTGQVRLTPQARRIAMIFQDLALWPHMSVAEHFDFVLRAQGTAPSERPARVQQALAWVDLTSHAMRKPATLSGGERRRVAIGRALIMEPALLLLDEPTANLDISLKRELLELLRELLGERRYPMIYVTHDAREARPLADNVAIMDRGSIVQRGSWAMLAVAPASAFVVDLLADLSITSV